MMIINLMSLDLDEAIEKALLEFGMEKKTKKFWDMFLENCILSPKVIQNTYNNVIDKTFNEVFKNQLEVIKENNVQLDSNYIKELSTMFFEKEMFNEQIFPLLMKNPINETIKKILSRNYHVISDEHRLYLTQIMDVNEMFTLGLLNDEIFKNNIDKFDFSLISKYGIKDLELTLVMNHMPDEYLASMDDISTNSRPNIGWEQMPGYVSGGFAIQETHSNGVSIYVPYGIVPDISKAIRNLSIIYAIEKDDSRKYIEQNKNNTDAASKYLVEAKKERLFTLEKDEMIFNSLLDCLYNL